MCLAALLSLPLAVLLTGSSDNLKDPFLWLEEVDGAEALEWVKGQNERSVARLEASPVFAEIQQRNLEIATSADRIPGVSLYGEHLFNFWQDGEHPRGLWRCTSLAEYRKEDPEWDVLLDVDALAEAEGENWVFKGTVMREPDFTRTLLALSRGGGDAVVYREFDLEKREFVADGFQVPEAKTNVGWKDADTLWIGTDFGEGSLTESGYPRVVKEWSRGTPLSAARTVFEGEVTDVSSGGYTQHTPEGVYHFVRRTPAFFQGMTYLVQDGELKHLDLPVDARFQGIFKERLLVRLRSPWSVGDETYPAGGLLAIALADFLGGARDFEVLFEPTDRISLSSVGWTRDQLLISTLDNVRGRLWRVTLGEESGWMKEEVPLPGIGTVSLGAASDERDLYFFYYQDYLTPSSLYVVDGTAAPERLKSTPTWFDSTGMSVAQYQATSSDGTLVPYFVVRPAGCEADGTNPTLLYGYGGFEISMRPSYSGITGTAWLARGGVYVVANIRGGGEFGPQWHQAALKGKRQRCFDDFIAVAEDLVARKITSPEHLGIQGGSNGGLLVGAVFTQRPDLFDAVVCAVPLLDMRRYHTLLAGASWMAEYGDPDDPKDWEYIRTWSPYHKLSKDAEYPEVFFYTSTRDDRVHPGHARKMVARMQEQGHPVLYWENTEGGHAAATNPKQRAYVSALSYAYLWNKLR